MLAEEGPLSDGPPARALARGETTIEREAMGGGGVRTALGTVRMAGDALMDFLGYESMADGGWWWFGARGVRLLGYLGGGCRI
ncbi:hypothetical protein GCM10027038_26580 [Arthrobacter bambusae]